jgi:toxin ParE1/3/4
MSIARVLVRAAARTDIDGISDYIARDNIDIALRFYDAAEQAFRLLATYPNAGARRLSQHPDLEDVRSWPIAGFRKYIIFYRSVAADIEIIRVLHGAREVERIIRNG